MIDYYKYGKKLYIDISFEPDYKKSFLAIFWWACSCINDIEYNFIING